MKTLALVLFAAFAAAAPQPAADGVAELDELGRPASPMAGSLGGDPASCSGCKKKESGAIPTEGAGVSVAYTFLGRGRSGIRFRSGTCTDAETHGCDETGCSIEPYTLTIKNTSHTRTLTVQDSRGAGSVRVAPGATTDFVFGDPASGLHETLACGEDIILTLSMLNGAGDDLGVREYRWECTECKPAASSVDPRGGGDPGATNSGGEPRPDLMADR